MFIYINLTNDGELIGGDPNDEALTLYIEKANLDNKHIQITPRNSSYFIKDLATSTGTWVKQGINDPILISEGLQFQIGNEVFTFTYGDQIEDQLMEYLGIFNLREIGDKIKDLGYKTLQSLTNLKFSDICLLDLQAYEINNLNNLVQEIKTTILPDIKELINKKLVITSVSTNKKFECGWEGCRFGNHDDVDIKIDLNTFTPGNVLSAMEGAVNFQFGKYWIHNSRQYPIKDLYKKLQPNEEYEVKPGDIIKVGNIEFIVNRFNYGQAEDKGKSKSMEDKSVVINDLVVSNHLSFSLYAVLDGYDDFFYILDIMAWIVLDLLLIPYLLISDNQFLMKKR